jgi:hypothetical protein
MSERRTRGHADTRTGAPGHGGTGAPTSLPRAAAVLVGLTLVLGAASCTTLDKAVGTMPWFTTMRDQPSIRPFEMPRTPPVGSVPTTGREDSLDLLLDLKDLANPLPVSWESQRRGRQVFEQYCIVCHGPAARGDGTVVAKFRVPQPPKFLRADMTVSIEVEVAERADAIVVPLSAVRDAAGASPWVLVVVDGRAEKRPVRLGARTAAEVQVTTGVAVGAQVIVGGDAQPGQRVRVRGA